MRCTKKFARTSVKKNSLTSRWRLRPLTPGTGWRSHCAPRRGNISRRRECRKRKLHDESCPRIKGPAYSPQPVFQAQSFDAGEFLFVVGNDGVSEGECLSRYQQIIGADWPANLLQVCT